MSIRNCFGDIVPERHYPADDGVEFDYEPRKCGGCSTPLINGECGDVCERCHHQERDRRE